MEIRIIPYYISSLGITDVVSAIAAFKDYNSQNKIDHVIITIDDGRYHQINDKIKGNRKLNAMDLPHFSLLWGAVNQILPANVSLSSDINYPQTLDSVIARLNSDTIIENNALIYQIFDKQSKRVVESYLQQKGYLVNQ